ncbi:transglutaminaseTgpA domain-containing protein [Amycolatopsis sp. NPDC088138]|uniref:transglutaminase family protein n=1 Tax=Amycolatopsis sp. NPDC088138 TaxID=3363938 RepID=UPI0037F26C64
MTARLAVVAAIAVAGLLFGPVFGWTPVLLPVLVTAAVLFGVAQLCELRPGLATWRPVLLVVAGLLAVVGTTLVPMSVVDIPAALGTGVTRSWRLVLQSTWPARPDPALLVFVPLLVVLAGTAALELLSRLRRPLAALAPSVVVLVLSQLYSAASGLTALVAAVAYFACVLAACVTARVFTAAVPLTALVAVVLAGTLPSAAAYSLQEQEAPRVDVRTASPLDEIAARLARPDVPVFDVRGTSPDRWPLVVLDDFDGVEWTAGHDYRRLGRELLPPPAVPVRRDSAEISVRPGQGPWLPSQPLPAAVTGADPLVEETEGSLLAPVPDAPTTYSLSWWTPEVSAATRLDGSAPGGLADVGAVPDGIPELAAQAVHGLRPTFESALVLERFFRDGYRRATGTALPAGHGWPQLRDFLLVTKRGTSEQFAAAYVALARIVGIPARLVVGYRPPPGATTVRNGDVLAWPEVAVTGVGWVPLDPSGSASSSSGLAGLTDRARAALPPSQELKDPPVAPPTAPVSPAAASGSFSFPFGVVLVVLGLLLVLWLVGVPSAKTLRAWRRRSRAGAGAVRGACEEVRDRLRDRRVPLRPGMTLRDYAGLVPSAGGGLAELSSVVDSALWSGRPAGDEAGRAWAAVRAVRAGLRGGVVARVRGALNPRSLFTRG